MTTISFIMKPSFIIVQVDGQTYNILMSHVNAEQLKEALLNKEWDKVRELVTPIKAIESFMIGSGLELKDDVIYHNGNPVNTVLTETIIEMVKAGQNAKPLIAFLSNVMENPSESAIFELYQFAEHGKFTITDDGCILAYKKVRHDFFDIYSGTMNNSPGRVVKMERKLVDDNRNNTCAAGLHFCSLSYLSSYGSRNDGDRAPDKVVIVKVNPKDVVSIPVDYNFTKGRACEYTVIGEHKHGDKDAFTSSAMFLAKDERTNSDILVPKNGWKKDKNGKWRDERGRFLNEEQIKFAERNTMKVAESSESEPVYDAAMKRWRDSVTGKLVKAPTK